MTQSQLVRRWIGSMATVAVGLVWLHLLGAGDLGAPPLSLHDAASWLDNRDTAIAAFALLRLVALGLGWYLLLTTAIGGTARLLQLPRLTSVVERLTLPFARGMLGGMALLGGMAAPPAVQRHTPDSMIELSAEPTSTTVPTDSSAIDDHATLHLLPDTGAPVTPVTPAPAPMPTPVAPTLPEASTADANSWVIQPGESFWSIAVEHLADVSGRPVTERELGSYWHQLVERNRSQLVNPNDADLLFTGQVIDLPAVAPG
jgi:hypothetical protein